SGSLTTSQSVSYQHSTSAGRSAGSNDGSPLRSRSGLKPPPDGTSPSRSQPARVTRAAANAPRGEGSARGGSSSTGLAARATLGGAQALATTTRNATAASSRQVMALGMARV